MTRTSEHKLRPYGLRTLAPPVFSALSAERFFALCGCGRRLVTGSCVIRETTQVGSKSIFLRIVPSIRFSLWMDLAAGAALVSEVFAGARSVLTTASSQLHHSRDSS